MFRDLLAPWKPTSLRRLAGWAWTSAWCLVLYGFARPWRELGGVVDERIRWAAWASLLAGSVLGLAIGALARHAAVETGRITHRGLLGRVLVPAATATACALVVLRVFGMIDVGSIVTLAVLATWAGIDLAFAAVPLMDGEPYAFARPLPPPQRDDDDGPAGDGALL